MGPKVGLALIAAFLCVPATASASHQWGPYSVEIIMGGVAQPVYSNGGQSFVAGAYGAAYQIRVHNRSGRRIEAIVAVDGRDVVTGQPVQTAHRGYIIQPFGSTSIAGFRSSAASVATFRFSTIPGSYAWRTGTTWGIGTIRVLVFEEAAPPPVVTGQVLPHGMPQAESSTGAAPSPQAMAQDMGTSYGEHRYSPVGFTSFVRSTPGARAVIGLRYNSREALLTAGIIPNPVPPPVYPVYPVYPIQQVPLVPPVPQIQPIPPITTYPVPIYTPPVQVPQRVYCIGCGFAPPPP